MTEPYVYYDLDKEKVDTSIPLIIDEEFVIDIIKAAAYRGLILPEFASRMRNLIELERKRGGLDD